MTKLDLKKTLAFSSLTIFFSLCLFSGFFSLACLLRDPDTCWILALGRYIYENKHLPYIDPFSSNLASYASVFPGSPLIQYQWLAELLFYLAYKIGNLTFLLFCLSSLITISFIIMPILLIGPNKLSFSKLCFIISGLMASSARFIARPELFSSLYLGLILFFLLNLFQKKDNRFKQILAITTITCLWTNSHMLFPLALIIIILICLIVLLLSENRKKLFVPASLCLIFSSLATLINPWGIGLWIYELRLLISPVSYNNMDHQGVIWHEPFGLALAICFCLCLFEIIKHFIYCRKESKNKFSLEIICSLILLLVAFIFSFKYAKLVPESYILSAAALGFLNLNNQEKNEINNSVSLYIKLLFSKFQHLWLTTIIVLSIIGSSLSIAILGMPILPGHTKYFKPPFKAIEFLNKHMPEGKLFNEGLFGSVMTWYLRKPCDLFIDSRFSMFEPTLVEEYEKIFLAESNWEKLLEKYKIDWIFVPKWSPLNNKLSQNNLWQKIYEDEDAIIISRKDI